MKIITIQSETEKKNIVIASEFCIDDGDLVNEPRVVITPEFIRFYSRSARYFKENKLNIVTIPLKEDKDYNDLRDLLNKSTDTGEDKIYAHKLILNFGIKSEYIAEFRFINHGKDTDLDIRLFTKSCDNMDSLLYYDDEYIDKNPIMRIENPAMRIIF